MSQKTVKWGKTPWTIRFRASKRRLPKRVEFAVIGGGFTGLGAAAWLARLAPGKSILLLEAEKIGNGASGRTGGMALAQTAAGDLPGLGNVLQGYRTILRRLGVKADANFPGVWEVARGDRSMEGKTVRPIKNSPIDWSDSGRVRAVGKVPGGTVDPGKVVSGLAQAATRSGAQIVEQAEVARIEFSDPLRLHVRRRLNGRAIESVVAADKVLIATNGGSLDMAGEVFAPSESAEPKLTFAIATAPLSGKQLAAIGMTSGKPFYTVDLPYLWGRRLKNGAMIFGSGLAPGFGESLRGNAHKKRSLGAAGLWSGLEKFNARRGEPLKRLSSLEQRVRKLHPLLRNIRVTNRWGGPILITRNFLPAFRHHNKSSNVIVAGGYSGHGVALSVYLGKWAAESLLGRRALPDWPRP